MVYIFFVVAIGVPLICSEFVIGRTTQSNVRQSLRQLERKGSRWHLISYVGIISSLMILSFYSVVAGWTIEYGVRSATGFFHSASEENLAGFFTSFTTGGFRPVLWVVVFLMCNYLILRKGLKNGIERMSNIMTPLLFVILVVFCVNSLMMPKAAEGLRFMFVPDFSAITPSVLLGAMGQAFFSLSLGVSCMMTYASYFNRDVRLVRTATTVAALDTMFAIVAGIIIFPALFSFGVEPEAGPKLVFEVLPYIFSHIAGGSFWATAFFFLLFLASITSTISMAEISIAFFSEEFRMSREAATKLCIGIALVFGILCALSFGPLSGFTICGKTLFNLFDFTTANILMPACGIFFSIFTGWLIEKKVVRDELTNEGRYRQRLLKPIVFCMRYLAPLAIAGVFIYQLVSL